MRIVHVITRLFRAGAEENTLLSCKFQIEAGHEVYLIHGTEFDSEYYNKNMNGLNLIEARNLIHPLNMVADFKAVFELRSILLRIKPDIVHTHQSKAGIVARFSAYLAKVPSIVHGIHIVPFENVGRLQRNIYLLAEKAAALVTNAFVSVSEGVRNLYLSNGIGKADKHFVVRSAFSLDAFENASPVEDEELLGHVIPNGHRKLLMLAAFEPRKRHIEFLHAFKKLVTYFPDVQLVLAGEGPEKRNVEKLVMELDLSSFVRIVGFRKDPERLVAWADVCILSSTREGLPRVLMQYIAGNRLVVASRIPGIEEILIHDQNSMIVSGDDFGEFERVLHDVLSDDELRARLTAGARATSVDRWSIKCMEKDLNSVYEFCISNKLN